MGLFAQIGAVLAAPFTLLRLRGRAIVLLAVYLLLAAGLLGIVAVAFVRHRGDLLHLAALYVLPEEWEPIGRILVERYLSSQLRPVLVNGTVGLSLVLVAALLFPLKERVSAAIEREARLVDEPPREFPLWFQAFEEIVLFLAFAASQMTIFWIGYAADPTRKRIALVLSYAVLFASFSISFISPLLQRHRLKYSTMWKVLARHPIVSLGFGALFTLPTVWAAKLGTRYTAWSFTKIVGVTFGVNIACIGAAVVAGTFVAARLLPAAQATRPPSGGTRVLGWLTLSAALGINLWAFSAVALSLHHKSQLLKCKWTVVPGTLHITPPDIVKLARGQGSSMSLEAEVEVANPTRFDVEIEDNRVEAAHGGVVVATTALPKMRVPAGGRAVERVVIPLELRRELLERWRSLLEWRRWSVTMHLRVADRFELPIYLVRETS
jgi:hypothetical protein